MTQIVAHLSLTFPHIKPNELKRNATFFMNDIKRARPLGKSEEDNAKTENRAVVVKDIPNGNRVQLYDTNFKPVNPHGKHESGQSYNVFMGYELWTDNATSSEQPIPRRQEEDVQIEPPSSPIPPLHAQTTNASGKRKSAPAPTACDPDSSSAEDSD
jgi:hypothetical protein